ncbi:glycosyltransferase [Actinosynnema sp. NPDC047251]|uniref:Glycosyltransferase, family 4 n=1 Tax=Saccharothrix espanaensis (strain ATCC 51144 / DSM 44229 / JCM 9112 / NBRC 15066 / NRRL 15764) TaxID=1179773 RepID=K0JWC3_SACES|nr:glycosyltransferase [Saccharothrix espanaensis]CCH32095.1 Glycosyltransferase, family 4 [Saccharothrix espanaensis DSM 44229]
MRIAMVTSVESDLPVVDLSGALTGSGHHVVVHSTRAAEESGPQRQLESFVAALRESWAAEPPDVVHAHRWTSGLAAMVAARPLDIPIVHTYQDTTRAPAERVDVERAVCRSAARVVATSDDDLPALLRLGVRRASIAVVPYGVDWNRFTPDGPRVPRGSAHRILTAASHGVPRELVAAVHALPDAELVVFDGPPPAAGPAAADGRVVRVQAGPGDLPALVRSADIVVCGPWCDRPSILAMQAMACGVAVVSTTSVGGMSDVVVHRVAGMVPAQGGPGGLVRVLSGLLADHARREAYAIAGIDRVLARYGLDRVAEDIADVYASAVRREGS